MIRSSIIMLFLLLMFSPFWVGADETSTASSTNNEVNIQGGSGGDRDDSKPKQKGSITICKVIVDADGKITNGSGVSGTSFTINGFTPSPPTSSGPPDGQIPNSVFRTPLNFNAKLFGSARNNAQCVTYDDLKIGRGGYYYSEETISNSSGWLEPKYNDQFSVPANSLNDFFVYSGEFFDSNPDNDGNRNKNADGHIVLTQERPDRTLIVLNRLAPPSEGKLKVIKQVVNTGGGTKTPSDFRITVSSTGQSPRVIQGNASGTVLKLNPGNYSVTEAVTDNYTASFSSGCSGNIAAGQTKTCTVTNTFEPSDTPTVPPGCPIPSASNRTIVSFEAKKILSRPGGTESSPEDISLPAGSYKVTLSSFDSYKNRKNHTQPHEQWFASLQDASGTIAESGVISDLPDMVVTASTTEVVNSKLNPLILSRPATQVVAKHAFPNHESPNSVFPVCAAFDRLRVAPPPAPTLEILPTSLPDGTLGVSYSQTLTATGTTATSFTWSLASGTLPSGLTLDTSSTAATINLSGTPNATGTFNFAVSVNDGSSTANRAYTINVTAPRDGGDGEIPSLSISPDALPDGTVGVAYSQTLTASGISTGTFNWSVATGTLPSGLSLDTGSTGSTTTISGTPNATGTFPFNISVTNGTTTASKDYSITINPAAAEGNGGGGDGGNGGGGGGAGPVIGVGNVVGGGGGGALFLYQIKINDGAAVTTSTNVKLTIVATGASEMLLSNNSDFSGATWQPFASTTPWTLTPGNGTKTVYGRFRSGNNILGSAQASIILSAPAGQVLGEATSCGVYITKYIKFGAKNDPEQVRRLQRFLNEEMDANLPITGFYGLMTKDWVDKFQVKYKEQVLKPWLPHGLPTEDTPTSYVYKTTSRWINMLRCPILNLPIPPLP